MREIPKDILYPFLKKAEGVRLKAYLDSGGVWTIGVGHTAGVFEGMVISANQVDAFLDEDIETAHMLVEKRIIDTSKLSEHQYATLISFVFNLGANPNWTIWKKINAGQLSEVPDQLRRFVYDGKVKVAGLINRREAEVALWNETDVKDAAAIIQTKLVKETPASGNLRDNPTPPEAVQEVKPLVQQKSVWAVGVAALSGAPAAINKALEVVEPWKHNSHFVQNMIEYMAGAGAVAAVLGLVFLGMRQWHARH